MYKLPNGRIEVGPEEETVLQQELDRINAQLAILKPKVEQDRKEMKEVHRKLWGF